MKPSDCCSLTRRQFLRQTAAAAVPLIVPGSILGLNGATSPGNRVVFGGIGIGNRAHALLPNFLFMKDLQFIAVSDCRADRLAAAKTLIDSHYGNQDCQTHPDFRDLLARKDIDAVLIATGNRWHGLGSIYAARAGKDVYSEKPVTLTIHEGRELVDTCRRYGTIYQAGTQRRSTESYAFAVDMVRQGRIGKVHTVEMQVWEGPALPHDQERPVPAGWNYEVWLGQTPWHPFVPARVNGWQYFWDTAEGIITDMGCHYTDQMQWALNHDDTGPIEFEAQGQIPDPTRFMSETPITATAKCRYADGVTGVMYQRGAFKDRYLRFIGDEGWIQVDDETDVVTAEPKSILSLKAAGGKSWADAGSHIRNLLDSIRSRRPTRCNPEVAHRAMTICEAMNLSLRLGRKLKWDPAKEQFDDAEANRMLERKRRAPWTV
ncbi:MAG: Gfo/Idh/MocA family oxidoreductase [Verrucomicrobia bacterium]|nr:Gfo/Idh/MocA family oxidoreductase [Verrucomicrobiota bacterium]